MIQRNDTIITCPLCQIMSGRIINLLSILQSTVSPSAISICLRILILLSSRTVGGSLSSPSSVLTEQSNNDSEEAVVSQAAAAVTKKFLRKDRGATVSSHQRLSSTHDDDDSTNKNEDYETLHEQLDIPLPALWASLMGKRISPSLSKNDHEDDHDEVMMYKGHSSRLPFASTNEAIQRLAHLEADYESNHQDTTTTRRNLSLEDEEGEERDPAAVPRLFAFAGTNQALLNLADEELSSQETNEEGTRVHHRTASIKGERGMRVIERKKCRDRDDVAL